MQKREKPKDGAWVLTRVKWYNKGRGYGFLRAPEDGAPDIFCHHTVLKNAGVIHVEPGDWVRAYVTKSPKGLIALAIELRE